MKLKIGTVCTGIGSPEQAIIELEIPHEIVFGCEIDRYAKQTYLANFNPGRMCDNMITEDWSNPELYVDIFIGGIPCQAFSLAGKRMGELDPRGLLFYNFYDYLKKQQPKYFIIENVKGLLSDAGGRTFNTWLELLGQSVNTHYNMFNHEDSLLYNLHWTVLNSKDFGVPQNRERIFIIGIRNDLPNDFRFPIGEPLKVRLKDVLEPVVDEKYYLSDKMLAGFLNHNESSKEKGNGFNFRQKNWDEIGSCITARVFKMGVDDNYIKVPEATVKGCDIAEEGDSINISNPKSLTRRGRVGKGIANTLDTACNQVIVEPICVAMRGRNTDNPSDRTTGISTEQRLEPNSQGITNTITYVQKDNLILEPKLKYQLPGYEQDGRIYDSEFISPTVDCKSGRLKSTTKNRIRRLTPLECFRLQGFPDSFIKPCSDTQTYKQAGNSITVHVIKAILKNLLKDYIKK
jgi:DNA (cytosine-5)-methyltransferase 1